VIEPDKWVSVLRLATRWNFPSFRALALEKLESVEPSVDKLVLAHELNVTDWLLPSYVALCLRPEPLTLEEAERLRMADVVLIFTAREALKGGTNAKSATACIEKLLAPKTKPVDISSADSPDVSQQPSQIATPKEAIAVEHIDISQAITDALNYHAYNDAVGLISEANEDDATAALINWVDTEVRVRGASSLQCLVTAIFYRCARDTHFAACAASILRRVSQSIDGSFCDEYDSRYTNVHGRHALRNLLAEFSSGILSTGNTFIKITLFGRDICSSTNNSELYYNHRRNTLTLIRELVRMQVIEQSKIVNSILFSDIKLEKLCPELISFSPILDIPDVEKAVENALDKVRSSLRAKRFNGNHTLDGRARDWAELRVGDCICILSIHHSRAGFTSFRKRKIFVLAVGRKFSLHGYRHRLQ
jgi:hypothetical protein